MSAEITGKRPARVAVITRTKNRELLLSRAIESVLGQTYASWHHVIVNDGGGADSVNHLLIRYKERYQDRLTVLHNEQSLGMEAASNLGVTASVSEYVVIHDDDDSWEPGFLQRCVEWHEKCSLPSVKGVVTHTTQIVEKIVGTEITEERRQELTPGLSAVSLPQMTEINRFMPIAFLFERSVFDDVGMFDESLPVIGDWDFNIRFLMKHDVIVLRESLANYHIRPSSQDVYGNTTTVGEDKHALYRALIVNKHMRADLESGKLTPGLLLAIGDYSHHISHNLNRVGNLLEKLKKVRFISNLRKFMRI